MSDQFELTPAQLNIGGRLATGKGGAFAVHDPATAATLVETAGASAEQVDEALLAAESGFAVWRNVPAVERAAILRKTGSALAADIDRLAVQLTREQGKPLSEARGEWQAAIDILDWYANEGLRAYGRIVPSRGKHIQQLIERDPVGPVAAFAPWNFPALTPMRKIAGSLAAGCSCILKAPEEAPLSSLAIAQALDNAGLPHGVLSILFGDAPAIAKRLVGSHVIRMVTFTGSTPVGTEIAALASRRALPLTLELGGHAPVVVFRDADLDRVFATAVPGKFRNAGQICIAPTRFIVHQSVSDQFTARLREYASRLRIGPGLRPDTQLGPVATARRQIALDGLLDKVRSEGGEIHRSGTVPEEGFFWAPAVVTGLRKNSALLKTEPFGPVAPCISFEDDDEAIAMANDVPFGLSAYIFTRTLSLAHHTARSVEAGMVGINTTKVSLPELPFGGVKQSGYGSEGGSEGLQDFLVTRSVSIDFDE
ncbi:TPA: NAD-dependent succinate-semialdehyde dehydrogenase [Burkholderia multivorans]|nr:NAD-dependent succinate-semialdehyde dehydrogenase [Burkholderia multivorans]